jgi:ribosomal protein S18 acetylase RimI-like enzyme
VAEGIAIHDAGPSDCEALGAFFEAIGSDPALVVFFHPHPFTREQAEWVCGRGPELRDRYLLATEGDSPSIVGYAMLRGWDEGYEVPAFGVCVRPGQQGLGIGRLLLENAIGAAKDAGAKRVMLKVHRDNAGARRLYESAGFAFAPDQETDQVAGYKELV